MIFCVEDDRAIRDLMIYTLCSAGFEAQGFSDGGEFFTALKNSVPQLVILDIMLPGQGGIEILKKLRQNAETADIPVIIASAKGTEYDKVIGLDSGADDYLAKPFGMMEMISRVKALLRRTERANSGGEKICAGNIELNTAQHTVRVNSQPVELTLKEYELLKKFMKNPRLVFTREQLLHCVWGSDFIGESRTVDVHIGTLRTKLGSAGEYIKTVRGVGYKLEVSDD
ncbi:MAG: response regulator transcription factor [Clostridiales bacterium]|nr:response regulator transcription factor [Clostridiales bacterium]